MGSLFDYAGFIPKTTLFCTLPDAASGAHLLHGVEAICQALCYQLADDDQWHELSVSTDFPPRN
jgi:hypothetical protein